MLKNDAVSKSIQDKATERFSKELDHEVQYILDEADKK
jgi:hypothetical protein